jgi:3-oxoacyl-[acyl-carrier protein] reductase
MRLKDKVAIVTGASSGIGRATAIRFGEEGAKVIVADVNDAGGQETVEAIEKAQGEALFVRADVSQREEVTRMVEIASNTYGAPQILANVAICGRQLLTENQFEPIVDVALRGTWICIQAVLPGMREMGGGSIINVSSVNALMGLGKAHVYSAVKAGIIGMSRSLCGEVGKNGIRINCICPGTIVTEIWDQDIKANPNVMDELKPLYPLGRLGKPVDIANAALFLASDESSFAKGAVFVIDGGISAVQMAFRPS